MNILLFSPWAKSNPKSGISIYYDYLASRLEFKGHVVDLISNFEEFNHQKRYSFIFAPNANFSALKIFSSQLANFQVLSLHTDHLLDHGASRIKSFLVKKKYVRMYNLKSINSYFSNSSLLTEHIKELIRPHNFQNKTFFEAPHPIMRNLTTDNSPIKFSHFSLYVGEISPRKQIIKLAWIYWLRNVGREAPTLVIVGNSRRHGWKLKPLLILTRKIKYLGNLEDTSLNNLIAACSNVLLPSRFESYGLVINEALFFGKPIHVLDLPWTQMHRFSNYLVTSPSLIEMTKKMVSVDTYLELTTLPPQIQIEQEFDQALELILEQENREVN